jgi:hypothetical protein
MQESSKPTHAVGAQLIGRQLRGAAACHAVLFGNQQTEHQLRSALHAPIAASVELS